MTRLRNEAFLCSLNRSCRSWEQQIIEIVPPSIFPTSNFMNNFLVSNSDSCSPYLSEYGSSEIILGPKSLEFQCNTKAGLMSKSEVSTQLLGRPALSELLTAFLDEMLN